MAPASGRFIHLHLHSEFSLLDGANRIDRLIDRVKELGMDAVALTDHGNLFGAVEFYTKAREAGIKPILGIEAYVVPDVNGKAGDRRDRTFTGVQDGGHHLVLLAENNTGWQNLLKLSSDAYINGFYFKPRMDKSTLSRWSEGLIALNGHLGSSVAAHLVRYAQSRDERDFEKAAEEARWHAETFSPNERGEPCFYIELQRHSVPEQEAINPHLQRLAQELGLPLVCDNDVHFLLEEDHDAHDTLCCISMGKTKQETNRVRYPRELYVKSPQQMWQRFEDLPEVVENTIRIADRCNVDLDFSQNHAPVVRIMKKGTEAPRRNRDRLRHEGTKEGDVGSTQWYNDFCGQYELLPFDSHCDDTPPDRLKADCDGALRELAEAGAIWRYGTDGISDRIRERLERELAILADKNISAYFLIVWDFVNEARRRGIPATARGSAVGTMVGYCLGLSNACPEQYGLLFERFTDPDRSEYPDIDIDMCQDGRQEIIDYVRQRYGHVAQIITFGTLKARAAIRDVGRVLGVPLGEVDKVCKLVGDGLAMTLEKALQQEPDLKSLYDDSPTHHTLIDTARRLEGLSRHAGVHAAGVVIATQPLDHIIPLYQPAGSDQLVTQWDGPTVEKAGLLKMDFLGLRTLSIIERARKLIRQTLDEETIRKTVAGSEVPDAPPSIKNRESKITNSLNSLNFPDSPDPLDLDRLSFDDQDVLDLFRRGETAGVFQFESGGMRNTLMGMKPDRFEDLIAANALFRPGPMELIGDYIDRKHGRRPCPKVHEVVDRFTAETYGIMIYQEQVMQIVHELGDIPLRDAYTLIKAISKKSRNVINANRARFIEGAGEKGLSDGQAEELFDLILKFAGYGFNKSHSTGYAIVAYQTAYLKTYFPVQYMAALLTYESVSTDKVVEYRNECRQVLFPDGHRGIEVSPPDINLSDVAFTVVFDDAEPRDANHGYIRFGLSAVKGVGEKAIESIIAARNQSGPYESLYDFCERVPQSAVNRATVEALIKCGAFDTVHGIDGRAAMVEALDGAIQAGQSAQADRDAGQLNFFEALSEDDGAAAEKHSPAVRLPTIPPWNDRELLHHEKSVLGFHVSSHPLDPHRDAIERFSNATLSDLRQLTADVPVTVGGMLTRVRPTVVRNGRRAGQKMAMITIEDHTGTSIEGVIFSDSFAIAAPLLEEDRIVFLKGKVDRRRQEPNIVVDEVVSVEHAAQRLTESVKIVVRDDPGGRAAPDRSGSCLINGELNNLKQLLHQAPAGNGGAQVLVEVHQDDCVVLLRVDGIRIQADPGLPDRIDTVLRSANSCELLGPSAVPQRGGASPPLPDEQHAPLHPAPLHEEEFCASLDRY